MLTRASFGDIHPECIIATEATAKVLEMGLLHLLAILETRQRGLR
jgi:hypothetical protein